MIDFYKRLYRPDAATPHYLRISKVATALWGVFACVVAVYASTLGSLIEVVNRFGSFFYGSILGVFPLAMLRARASGTGAFVGLIAGMAAVAAVAFGRPDISFLWHNVIGASVVFLVGLAVRPARPLQPPRLHPSTHFFRSTLVSNSGGPVSPPRLRRSAALTSVSCRSALYVSYTETCCLHTLGAQELALLRYIADAGGVTVGEVTEAFGSLARLRGRPC